MGVDEKSFRGHEYVTVVCDLAKGTVLYVGDDRTKGQPGCLLPGVGARAVGGNRSGSDGHVGAIRSLDEPARAGWRL